MNQRQLKFWLGLFDAGYKNAYMSVIDLKRSDWTTRIELVLPNVGLLHLYQGFDENDNGEQIPKFKVFYAFASNMNIRTAVQNSSELSMAVNLVYKARRYFESDVFAKKDYDLIKDTAERNEKFVQKMHAKLLARQKNRIY